MYCPNCGNQNSQEQRFCRSCGLRLDSISQAVQQELHESTTIVRSPTINVRGILFTAWHYGFFLIALGLIIITFGKKIIGEQLVAEIGSIMSVLGLGLLIARGILLLKAQSHIHYLTSNKADTTKQLPPSVKEEPPSVTEFTTRNLEPVYAQRKDSETRTSNRRPNS